MTDAELAIRYKMALEAICALYTRAHLTPQTCITLQKLR